MDKSGKVAWISEGEQRQSSGEISKRHRILERNVVRDIMIRANILQRTQKKRVGKREACTICQKRAHRQGNEKE